MIVSFSVSNFRSFLAEETLSLIASKRLSASQSEHDLHTMPIPNSDERVLRMAVIYGANGAGKSNLFKALRYVERVALRSSKRNAGTKREAFHFRTKSELPSTFDLQFIANNKLYRFGFKADDVRITEEWLVEVIGNQERIIYERITDSSGKVEIEAKELKAIGKKLAALATIGGPQNQSFLATINITLDSSDIGDELLGILKWFKHTLDMVAPDESYASLGHELNNDSNFLKFAGEFLKSSSTGVDFLSAQKTEISEDELRSMLPKQLVEQLIDTLNEKEGELGIVRLPNGSDLVLEKTSENHFYKLVVQAAHQPESGELYQLDISDESDGTRRLLDLIPILHKLRNENAVYFIDEIDRSMHPMLVWKYLDFFLHSCNNKNSQIIVTTHESNLLDLELVRRDEIWFTEKDQELSTKLYSMMDFKVRKDLEIRKHYLQGRFGAIPFLGNIENLRIEAAR